MRVPGKNKKGRPIMTWNDRVLEEAEKRGINWGRLNKLPRIRNYGKKSVDSNNKLNYPHLTPNSKMQRIK